MTSPQQVERLRKKSVSVDKSDVFELKPRMIDHLRVSKPSRSTGLSIERKFKKEAECVEGRSVAMRSGAVKYARDQELKGLGIEPKQTIYPFVKGMLEPFGDPKSETIRTPKLHKKTKQNSSELAKPRRLPTACFGLNRKQETESYATQVVDSHYEVGVCKRHERRSES